MITVSLAKSSEQLDETKLNELVQVFSRDEKEQMARYKRWQDRQLFLFGKLLVKKSLAIRGIDPNTASLKKNYYGKPFIEGGPHFNISHSSNYVVCAMSDIPVGIDIEKIAPIEVSDFINQWHDNEVLMLQNAVSPIHSFYWLWTRKESVIKADGRGLSIPLSAIDVSSNTVNVDKVRWYLTEIEVDKTYVCHVAYTEPLVKIDVAVISF